jgi:hypothetical protein
MVDQVADKEATVTDRLAVMNGLNQPSPIAGFRAFLKGKPLPAHGSSGDPAVPRWVRWERIDGQLFRFKSTAAIIYRQSSPRLSKGEWSLP